MEVSTTADVFLRTYVRTCIVFIWVINSTPIVKLTFNANKFLCLVVYDTRDFNTGELFYYEEITGIVISRF